MPGEVALRVLSDSATNVLDSKTPGERLDESVMTSADTSQLDNQENKLSASQKIPKFTKNLFPFMRKSRKRRNATDDARRKSLKSRAREKVNFAFLKQHKSDETFCANMDAKESSKLPEGAVSRDVQAEGKASGAPGFRKIKVVSKQSQRNVHADYATRVVKVRRHSPISTTSDESKKSLANIISNKDSVPRTANKIDQPFLQRNNNMLASDEKSRSENARSTANQITHGCQQTPFSSAAPTEHYSLRCNEAKLNRRASCVSTDLRTDLNSAAAVEAEEVEEENTEDLFPKFNDKRIASKFAPTWRNNSVAICQNQVNQSWLKNRETMTRCSLNLELFRNRSFHDKLSFITSLPGPETKLTEDNSGSSLDGLSTPGSSIITAGYLSVARGSLASSYSSVFAEEPCNDQPKVKVPLELGMIDQTKPDDTGWIEPEIASATSRVIKRSKSLYYRAKAPSKLHIANINRRSVSPTFQDNVSKCGFLYDNKQSFHNRIQSLKDLSSYRRPNKPTTPKPRKMSSSSSTSSLNIFNFPVAVQGVEPATETTQSAAPWNSQDPSVIADDVEIVPTSAKNASIRRRISLKTFKPKIQEITDDEKGPEWKRHSIAGFGTEQVKTAMVYWSVGTTNVGVKNTTTTTKRARRRIRPLSEVQNLRWEVKAIPEHKEVSDDHCPDDVLSQDTLSSTVPSESLPPSIHCDSQVCQPLDAASRIKRFSTFLDCDINVSARLGLLGTCYSEENISTVTKKEISGDCGLLRSLSEIDGLNRLSLRLTQFSSTKNSANAIRRPSIHPCPSPPYTQEKFKYCRVQGNPMSATISAGSELETTTRKNTNTTDQNVDEEETSASVDVKPRLASSEDFLNDDGVFVEALWDHVTMDTDELGFKVGDVIRVIDLSNADWWWGELDSCEGWFPATFVRILVNQLREDPDYDDVFRSRVGDDVISISSHEYARVTSFGEVLSCQCALPERTDIATCSVCGRPTSATSNNQETTTTCRKPTEAVINSPGTTNNHKNTQGRDRIRKNVINEIVNSEKVFVGHLKDLVEGYLARCRKRSNLFNEQQVTTLFGNLEEIYKFQQTFAAGLQAALNRATIHATKLGDVFLTHKSGFDIYSEYCNNHPQALALLAEMFNEKKYIQFFETCRLLQKMTDISLDGFLLTPVQKICKYPLQLAELLKYTSPDHPDYEPVKSALDTMKAVARMINERKRKMENIMKISQWQSTIANWQGDDVLLRSSQLVHSGEISTICKSKHKPKNRLAFLFDHQMIICKKDLLRKDLLFYKSRVDLDRCNVTPMDAPSPRNSSSDLASVGSGGLPHGWKVTDRESGSSKVMLCKSDEGNAKWMKAFALEREIVLATKGEEPVKNDRFLKEIVLTNSLATPRKPKEASASSRVLPSYRYRAKLAQEINQSAKHKSAGNQLQKSASFFSSVAGKLAPFRKTTARDDSLTF